MKRINTLLFLFIFSAFSTSCAQQKPFPVMNISELKSAMKNDKSLVILDVRTPEELKGPLGQIDGVINIPVQELERRVNELSEHKDKNIAVICRSGNRSIPATSILIKNGFNAKNVLGGMIQYRAEQ